jgi:hypothetical protein
MIVKVLTYLPPPENEKNKELRRLNLDPIEPEVEGKQEYKDAIFPIRLMETIMTAHKSSNPTTKKDEIVVVQHDGDVYRYLYEKKLWDKLHELNP